MQAGINIYISWP